MRESRSYGSVRGVAGGRYPYRDPHARLYRPQIILTPGRRSTLHTSRGCILQLQ
jgi:hypothetical protein